VNTDRTILVTGATGRQGGAVARHLLDAGFRVRALARTPTKPAAVALEQAGAEIVRGDMEDAASLRAAVAGAWGVFSVQNFWEKGVGHDGEIRQARLLADAARQAGVGHFVQASVADADRAPGVRHFECKAVIERYIDEIGLPRTFLGAVFYTDNFADPKAGGMMLPVLGSILRPETRLHLIAVDDIGAIAAVVFQNPGEYIGRKIDIAGDVLTVQEMREAYERVTGRRAKRWTVPGVVVRLGMSEVYRQLTWNNDPGWQFDLETARRIHPRLTSFEQYIAERQITNL
jgi:uncharacterized protein YbjT (DUF2867 family)